MTAIDKLGQILDLKQVDCIGNIRRMLEVWEEAWEKHQAQGEMKLPDEVKCNAGRRCCRKTKRQSRAFDMSAAK